MSLKSVLIFAAGVVVGSGSTFLVVRNIVNKKADKKLEDRINEELSKLYPQKSNEPEKKEAESSGVTSGKVVVGVTGRDTSLYQDVIERKEYSSPSIANDKEKTMQDVVEDKVKATTPKTSKPKAPKRVTLEEYDSTEDEKRMTLYYYADGILADDDDVKYDDVETIGASNIKTFKKTYDNMYVFNPATGFVYEIKYRNITYAEAIAGDDRLF